MTVVIGLTVGLLTERFVPFIIILLFFKLINELQECVWLIDHVAAAQTAQSYHGVVVAACCARQMWLVLTLPGFIWPCSLYMRMRLEFISGPLLLRVNVIVSKTRTLSHRLSDPMKCHTVIPQRHLENALDIKHWQDERCQGICVNQDVWDSAAQLKRLNLLFCLL